MQSNGERESVCERLSTSDADILLDVFRCSLCGESLPLHLQGEHSDYHFSLSLQEEEERERERAAVRQKEREERASEMRWKKDRKNGLR